MTLMELIDEWAKGYAMHSKEGDEARAAVLEAVEKLKAERDMYKATAEATVCMHCDAENAKLRQTISDIAYGLEGARIWGGMEWAYNPLHPYKYLPLRDAARAALGEAK